MLQDSSHNRTGQVWCNDCNVCPSKGCNLDENCAFSGIGYFFAFFGILILCALACVGLVIFALVVRGRRHPVAHPIHGRIPVVIFLIIAGIPQVVTQYYSLFDRSTVNTDFSNGNTHGMLPPCITGDVYIGVWKAGYNRIDTGDFLSTCADGSYEDVKSIRGTAVAGLVFSILACFFVIAFASPIPGAAAIVLHAIMLLATVGQAEALYGAGNFCGSGLSLEDLGFDKSAAVSSQWASLVMCGLGVGMTGLLRLLRPDCFRDPAESVGNAGAYSPVAATGVVVSIDANQQYQQQPQYYQQEQHQQQQQQQQLYPGQQPQQPGAYPPPPSQQQPSQQQQQPPTGAVYYDKQ